MPNEEWTARRIVNLLRRQSLLQRFVVVVLLLGALSTGVATVLGLASFRDVAYSDSANLLRVGELVRAGYIYPDFNLPPYYPSPYGPLFYVLLAIPYKLAQAIGVAPQMPVRLALVGILCFCVWLIFSIAKRTYGSRTVAWLCALFVVSAFPVTFWTTLIRCDFPALGFSLLGLYLFLLANGRPRTFAAAIPAGIALLVKQTFVAAPVAMIGWLVFKRRYKEAILWSLSFALTVAGGYALVGWHEPLMMRHIIAMGRPIFEYRQALDFIGEAVSQPVVPFAVIGGLSAVWKSSQEKLLLVIYCVVAWLVAILTIPQAGGAINYFLEPLLASAILAGPGLCELQRKANRTPVIVTAMLFVLLCGWLFPVLREDLVYLRQSYADLRDYAARKRNWESFVSVVSGRRLLSTVPDVAVLSSTPEVPEPIMNFFLERRGQWNSNAVVTEMDASVFDLIVIGPRVDYRGLRAWDDAMWGSLKENYQFACVFENMEVWLPHRDTGELASRLSAIGCQSPPKSNGLGDWRQ